jgi:hypothetical protein
MQEDVDLQAHSSAVESALSALNSAIAAANASGFSVLGGVKHNPLPTPTINEPTKNASIVELYLKVFRLNQ